MVKYLLAHGANVNMQYNTGATLLFEACRKNDFCLVKYLVEEIKCKGLDIEDIQGNTPLFMAIKSNNKGIVDEYRRPKMAYRTVKELFRQTGCVKEEKG